MAATPAPDRPLEIGHVLFMDMVGYSKLLLDEQRELQEQLTQIVRNTQQVRAAEAAGKLIRIPVGDGMALVFFNSPEAPVQCAIDISRTLKNQPHIPLRMGIHSGPVNEVRDVNDRRNVAGAGINIAQQVMDCGDAGHILLSKRVAEDLAQSRHWRPYLHDLGECAAKHGVPIFVVSLYNDEIGNPQLPEKFKLAQQEQAAKALRSARRLASIFRRKHVLIAAAVLLIFACGLGIWFYSRQATVATSPPEKSIAVLPFDNLSRDPDNAYFTEGIQEEILTRLAKIADLKVISRTSTERFKSAPEDLPQIARQLGVVNILQGSVQKSADQVRVTGQLIDARTGTHLWAESYDRKLTDIFAVESDVAMRIAETLRATLTGAEETAIGARPTENSEAHDLYLRGRYFFGKRDDFKRAIDYFNQAIAKDPNYALAYAGLADSYTLLPQYSREFEEEFFAKAKAAAEKALALDDNLAEAHVSRGLVLRGADLNLKEAKREFERAIELNPNYADAHYFLGRSVFALLGQFDRAIAEVKRAVELDPFSVIINANLGNCYLLARRYPEAIAQLRKTVELDPEFPHTRMVLGAALELSGDSTGAIREYEEAYHIEKADEAGRQSGLIFLTRAYASRGEREKALQLLGEVQRLGKRRSGILCYDYAVIQLALGNKNEAIDWLERSHEAKEVLAIAFIRVDPFLDPLRGEPRFERLANQIIPPDSR